MRPVGAAMVGAAIFGAVIDRAAIYGSLQTIREFGWPFSRPVVDGSADRRADPGGHQSRSVPRVSRTLPAGLGRRMVCLWYVSLVNWPG